MDNDSRSLSPHSLGMNMHTTGAPLAVDDAQADARYGAGVVKPADGPSSKIVQAWEQLKAELLYARQHPAESDEIRQAAFDLTKLEEDGHTSADEIGLYHAEVHLRLVVTNLVERADTWWEEEGKYERDESDRAQQQSFRHDD